jgi:CheY-like chemotaxis protein
MARPIGETPVLYGKDAVRFLNEMENVKPASLEEKKNIEIRKLSREDAKDVKIIAMTANAYEHDEKKSIAAGMNKHMIKPIDSTELFSTLSEYYKK